MDQKSYEKLGAFYLGRPHDLASSETADGPLLYDSSDLVTHAVCVGMTGSGKTGLCIDLIEEAALDGIPALLIDPKGDLANLLLTFPDLEAADFRPWINEDDARRARASPAEYASQQAELWRQGLAEWGQDGERIRRLRKAVELHIYTPGSTAGLPVSILASLAAPPAELIQEEDLFAERIAVAATSLLALLGIDADPVQSREHLLLSSLFQHAWRAGRDLDLASLIRGIRKPPLQRLGVMELESFYSAEDRFELAARFNNLLAAPSFASWLKGVPLEVDRLLYTPEGKPRVAIFSIAHLPDAERMFFVSLLLNQTLGWVRTRSGTTSLRALLYMDEIFGYLPPVAEPPSKRPLLTLMKQGRAFGFGVVLATQNPVDLDYKALSNAGTWFLGRLQTERDKARVLDGLEGAAASQQGFDRKSMGQTERRHGMKPCVWNSPRTPCWSPRNPLRRITRSSRHRRHKSTAMQIGRRTWPTGSTIDAEPRSGGAPAWSSSPGRGRTNAISGSAWARWRVRSGTEGRRSYGRHSRKTWIGCRRSYEVPAHASPGRRARPGAPSSPPWSRPGWPCSLDSLGGAS